MEGSAHNCCAHFAWPARSTGGCPPGIPFTRRACLRLTGAPSRAWPAPGGAEASSKMRQAARRRATPALTPSWPRLAPPRARCCAMAQSVCWHASRKDNSPARHGWPDPLRRRQESAVKRAAHRHQYKCQQSGEGTFFLVRTLRVCFGGRRQQVMPATAPARRPDPGGGQVHHAAALLYFAAVPGP